MADDYFLHEIVTTLNLKILRVLNVLSLLIVVASMTSGVNVS